MKSMLKSILVVLCLFVVFSSIFQGGEVNSNPTINEDIGIFEENIENGNIIENETYFEEEYEIIEGNLFGKIGYIICRFFVSIITGFIKVIVELISKII